MPRRPAPPDPDIRPRRKDPPKKVKAQIYLRQNGRCHYTGARLPTIHHCEWQHDPPLATRPVRPDGLDYDPPQLDPDYLFAVHPDAHRQATNGPDVEKRHLLRRISDKGKIARTKSLRDSHRAHLAAMNEKECGKPPARPSRWAKRPFPRRP